MTCNAFETRIDSGILLREPVTFHAWVGDLMFEGDTAGLAIRVLQDAGAAPRWFSLGVCGLHGADTAVVGFRER